MKELSIEEKAKRYDEALKVLHKYDGANIMFSQSLKEEMFPELAESEDERIRKDLLGYLHTLPNHFSHNGSLVTEWIAWLEKQGEQKSADKVEPKFHEGDWVVYKNDICQIVKREEGCNKLVTVFGIEKELVNERNLSTAHLWTIQDAKDGDVLYECNEKKPFIFKELKTKHIGDIASYCDIFNGIFNPNKDDWTTLDIVPATKEQRDTLMKAMADAGYTFDFDKKELKKIEQKAAWSEEDDSKLKEVLYYIEYVNKTNVTFQQRDLAHLINWLKFLKERVGCEVNCTTMWKPSDEQMIALRRMKAAIAGEGKIYEPLNSLYEDLKKLREE